MGAETTQSRPVNCMYPTVNIRAGQIGPTRPESDGPEAVRTELGGFLQVAGFRVCKLGFLWLESVGLGLENFFSSLTKTD